MVGPRPINYVNNSWAGPSPPFCATVLYDEFIKPTQLKTEGRFVLLSTDRPSYAANHVQDQAKKYSRKLIII